MNALDGHPFQPTRWTLVVRATKDDSPTARAALDELCRLYWPPLFSFAQRWGLNPEDAEDATQSYFAELLRQEKFASADADRGKLRTFLLHTFSKRLLNFRRDRQTQSRGGGQTILSLDAPLEENSTHLDPADPNTPEKEFNRQWAITTMEAAMARLEADYRQAGNSHLFDTCRGLLSPAGGDAPSTSTLARSLGIKEGALRVAVHRLRQRFRETLFTTVAETLDTPTEAAIRTEIGLLMESLG